MPTNRDRLIEAASDLFHRRGYHATSIDDVLQATGVSKSNLYYHFASKTELAVAVVERWIGIYDRELITPSLDGSIADPIERLRELYRLAAASQSPADERTGCPLGRLSTDLSAEVPEVRARLVRHFDRLRERIAETLREAAPGRLRGVSPAALSAVAVTVLEGGLLLSHLYADGRQVSAPGNALVDVLGV